MVDSVEMCISCKYSQMCSFSIETYYSVSTGTSHRNAAGKLSSYVLVLVGSDPYEYMLVFEHKLQSLEVRM